MRSAWRQFKASPDWIKAVIILFILIGLSFIGWLIYHFANQPESVQTKCYPYPVIVPEPTKFVYVIPTPRPIPTLTPTSPYPPPCPTLPGGGWEGEGIFPAPEPEKEEVYIYPCPEQLPRPEEVTEYCGRPGGSANHLIEYCEDGVVRIGGCQWPCMIMGKVCGALVVDDIVEPISICFLLEPGKVAVMRNVELEGMIFVRVGSEEEGLELLDQFAEDCYLEEGRAPVKVYLPREASKLGCFQVGMENWP